MTRKQRLRRREGRPAPVRPTSRPYPVQEESYVRPLSYEERMRMGEGYQPGTSYHWKNPAHAEPKAEKPERKWPR
jgi:hypothetical protein